MPIGMESWFHNFSQFIPQANTPRALADVPRPYLEYALWGMFKGAEVTSVVGGLIIHPIYRRHLTKTLDPEKTTPNSHKIIRNTCRRLQGRFLLAGLFIGPAVAAIHSTNIPIWELQEKCYKIRCDREWLTVDRATLVFGFVGWYWKRFQGAVDGINVGIAYALINNKFIEKKTSPMLVDKVKPEERFESVEVASKTKTELDRFLREMEKQTNR